MNKTVLVADTIFELTEQLEHFNTMYNVVHVVYHIYPEYCAAEIQYKVC